MIRNVTLLVLLLAAVITGVLWALSFIIEADTDPLGLKSQGLKTQRIWWQHKWNVKNQEGWPMFSGTYDLAWVYCKDGKIALGYQREFYGRPNKNRNGAINVPALFRIGTCKQPMNAPGPEGQLKYEIWKVDIYLWWPFLLFIAYPSIAFFRGPLRRYRRRKKGLCLKCGYNLTGNVSGVCPECGEKI